MSGDEDVIKNPARSNGVAEYVNYTPQHRILRLEPELVETASNDGALLASTEQLTDDNARTRKSNSEEDLDQQTVSMPNVGNHSDHLWPQSGNEDRKAAEKHGDEDNKYILVANKEIIFIGSLRGVEEEVRKVFYEEHSLCKSGITVDDLVVLKKIKINVGVFLQE